MAKGFTLWLTGLSGSGKTTLTLELERIMLSRGLPVQRLDGDNVRQDLTADLGFSREDRDKNIARVAFVADLLTRNGVICLASFISPYREARERARRKIGSFVEVYVDCSLEACIARDVKGLYKRAIAGEVPAFTGISDPYEAPENPEIVVRTDQDSLEACVDQILSALRRLGYLDLAAGLIAPHAGRLTGRILPVSEHPDPAKWAGRRIEISFQTAKDIENLAVGVYSPLEGFLVERDFNRVLSEGRLADDTPWTIPLLLHVSEVVAGELSSGETVALYHDQTMVGLLEVREVYRLDRDHYARCVFGTDDQAHPGVARLKQESDWVVAGPVSLVTPLPSPFPTYRTTPLEARRRFGELGWKEVVAFQTRNAPHIGHEYLQKTALALVDGLYVNPVIGPKKSGDFEDEAIIASCEALLTHYFPPRSAVMGILEYEMKYAGPREAIHHAIMRQNLGCSHLIVGRDHAGVGSYYGPYEAQLIFDRYPDLLIRPIKFSAFYYCRRCGTVTNDRVCPHGPEDRVNFSGTAVRAGLSGAQDEVAAAPAPGGPPGGSEAMIRPEVLEAIRRQPRVFVE